MLNLDERRRIASKLQALSTPSLELNEVQKYISLTVGTTPYKNAITVSKAQDKVSFYIERLELLDEIRTAGFRSELTPQEYGYNKSRYWIYKIGPEDIDHNATLFKNLIAQSVEAMISRRSKNQ